MLTEIIIQDTDSTGWRAVDLKQTVVESRIRATSPIWTGKVTI